MALNSFSLNEKKKKGARKTWWRSFWCRKDPQKTKQKTLPPKKKRKQKQNGQRKANCSWLCIHSVHLLCPSPLPAPEPTSVYLCTSARFALCREFFGEAVGDGCWRMLRRAEAMLGGDGEETGPSCRTPSALRSALSQGIGSEHTRRAPLLCPVPSDIFPVHPCAIIAFSLDHWNRNPQKRKPQLSIRRWNCISTPWLILNPRISSLCWDVLNSLSGAVSMSCAQVCVEGLWFFFFNVFLPAYIHRKIDKDWFFSPCGEAGVGWEEENLIMICLCWEGAVCNNLS